MLLQHYLSITQGILTKIRMLKHILALYKQLDVRNIINKEIINKDNQLPIFFFFFCFFSTLFESILK